jgi:hypothetical protein
MSDALKDFWKFEETDLAANRNGQLSENQKDSITKEHTAQKNNSLKIGAAFLVMLLCLPVLAIGSRVALPALVSGNFSMSDLLPARIGFGTVIVMLVPLFIVIGIYFSLAGKKADLTVKQAAGKAVYSWGTKRVRNPGNKARPYDDVRVSYLALGDKKFEVHDRLREIIREGEEWKVYYISYPFKFLSGEAVGM